MAINNVKTHECILTLRKTFQMKRTRSVHFTLLNHCLYLWTWLCTAFQKEAGKWNNMDLSVKHLTSNNPRKPQALLPCTPHLTSFSLTKPKQQLRKLTEYEEEWNHEKVSGLSGINDWEESWKYAGKNEVLALFFLQYPEKTLSFSFCRERSLQW